MKTIEDLIELGFPEDTEDKLVRLLLLRRKLSDEGIDDDEDNELDYLEDWLYHLTDK